MIAPQNAEALLTVHGLPEGEVATSYVACVDGLGREDLSYGYEADDVVTPMDARSEMLSPVLLGAGLDLGILAIHHCAAPMHIEECRRTGTSYGFAGFAAPSRALDSIPVDSH